MSSFPCPPCSCGRPGPCTCGGSAPSPGAWQGHLQQCWNDIQQFRCFILQVLGDITRQGPIIGDISGKPAQPGQVGEYVSNSVTGNFTTGLQTQSVSAIILQPGDWEVEAECLFLGPTGTPLNLNGAMFVLGPPPSGASSNMYTVDAHPLTAPAAGAVPTADITGWAQLISPRAQIVSAVPTLVAFNLTTNLQSAGTAGTFNFTTTALRVR
jgi:hypothetical protein